MLSNKITVVFNTRNEEARAEMAIQNFLGIFPMVASDNQSTDSTRNIFAKCGVPVYLYEGPRHESRENFEHMYEIAPTEYLLTVPVGEFYPLPLLKLFAEIAEKNTYDIVLNSRRSITHGVSYYGWWNETSNCMRFFKKTAIDTTKIRIHQGFKPVVPEERILRLGDDPELCVYQLRDYDAVRMLQVVLDYGVQEADNRHTDGKSFSLYETFKRSAIACFLFFWRGGWRRGRLGFRELWCNLLLTSFVYWRGSDLKYSMTRASCSAANQKVRQELMRRFNS